LIFDFRFLIWRGDLRCGGCGSKGGAIPLTLALSPRRGNRNGFRFSLVLSIPTALNVAVAPVRRVRGVEVAEGLEHMEGAELKGSVIELGGVEVGGESDAGFLASAGLGQPGLFKEPILVAAFFPLGQVVGFEVFTVLAQAFDDVGVGDAIEHPLIDLVADRFGEARDFAVTPKVERGERWRAAG